MARGSVAIQVMDPNPYPRPKEHVPMSTLCELCDRIILTKDWIGHKNSKKHREAEAREKEAAEDKANNNGFGGNSAGFQPETDSFGGADTFGASTTGNDGWGNNNNFGSSNFGNTTSGGSGGGCYTCGQSGHQKRDCPQGGGGGRGRECYGCGQTGHQKRDCPNGGSGGGQACFNCGEIG
jgi:hypothetical protein